MCMYVYVCVCVCMYVCVYVCVCVHMYIHMCVCVCVQERVLIMSFKGGVSYDNDDHYQPSGRHKSYY